MGTKVTVKNFSDTYVAQNAPAKNFSTNARTKVAATGSSAEMRTYEYWVRPFNLGVTILSAKLYIQNARDMSGTVTLSVKRLTKSFSVGKVNWNNKPTSA